MTLRPTMFGLVLAVMLAGAWFLRPATADPSVAALVWSGLAGVMVLGLVGPVLMVRLVRIEVTAAPSDLVVGELASLELRLRGRAAGLSISVTDSRVMAVDVTSPSVALVPFVVQQRGVSHDLRLELGSDAPFGVLWAMRRMTVRLPNLLWVGPDSEYGEVEPDLLMENDSQVSSIRSESMGEAVRAVRPYVSGDPAHLVHWPSTARVGSLVIREFEPPTDAAIAVLVDLEGEAAERTARRAAGLVDYALARGARVVLCTAEAAGPVSGEVADLLSARRRLAVATPGPPAPAPFGWPAIRLSGSRSDLGSELDLGSGLELEST